MRKEPILTRTDQQYDLHIKHDLPLSGANRIMALQDEVQVFVSGFPTVWECTPLTYERNGGERKYA